MSKQSLYFLLKLIHFHTNEGKCSLNIEYQMTNKSDGDELLKKSQVFSDFLLPGEFNNSAAVLISYDKSFL